MFYLPRSAEFMSDLCAAEAQPYSLDGVRLCHDDIGFRLVAADGHVLGILRGPNDPAPDDLDAAAKVLLPDAVAEKSLVMVDRAVIPGGTFRKALRAVPKRKKGDITAPRRLGVILAEPESLLVAGEKVFRAKVCEARYPDYLAVVPTQGSMISLQINPRYLMTVLKVAAEVAAGGPKEDQVTLLYYGPGKPLGISCVGADGMFFDAIVMPLTKPKK